MGKRTVWTSWIFWVLFEKAHESKLHHLKPQESRTWSTIFLFWKLFLFTLEKFLWLCFKEFGTRKPNHFKGSFFLAILFLTSFSGLASSFSGFIFSFSALVSSSLLFISGSVSVLLSCFRIPFLSYKNTY